MHRLALVLIASVLTSATAAEDAQQIMRRSVVWDQSNWERARDYTYIQQAEERFLDGKGKVAHQESQTDEVVFLYGRPYTKRIAKNGKPLAPDAARKEEQKMNSAAEERRRDEAQGGRKRQEWEKKRSEERAFLQEIPEAYNFTILREDQIDGQPVWVIAGEPRSGYRPKVADARILTKIKPTFWIDKRDCRWVRADGEVLDTISFGLFLARFNRGTTLSLRQARVNNEVWMPQHLLVHLDARLALLKKLNGEFEITWRNYRKFQTDSKIVPVVE